MFKQDDVSGENFDALLKWLDRDRDNAAVEYERIRKGLIRIFANRGCTDAEMLADVTITRVALKCPEIANGYDGEPGRYFVGVASHVHQEWVREFPNTVDIGSQPPIEALPKVDEPEQLDCLEDCLENLSPENRLMIIEYYQGTKGTKIANRVSLAQRMEITMNALHVRTMRVRNELRNCLEECLETKKV